MDSVLRAFAIYIVLMALFRITGKRSLAQITPFDFILLLIIAEATQQALLGDDFSVTNALVVVSMLIGIDLGLSLLARRWSLLEKLTEGVPVVIVEDGQLHHKRIRKNRLSIDDVLEAARTAHGIERMDQIKYAVLERSGGISIIPNSAALRSSSPQ